MSQAPVEPVPLISPEVISCRAQFLTTQSHLHNLGQGLDRSWLQIGNASEALTHAEGWLQLAVTAVQVTRNSVNTTWDELNRMESANEAVGAQLGYDPKLESDSAGANPLEAWFAPRVGAAQGSNDIPDDAPVTGGIPEAAMDSAQPKHNVVNADDQERINNEVQALLTKSGYASNHGGCDGSTATEVVATPIPFVPATRTAAPLQPDAERASTPDLPAEAKRSGTDGELAATDPRRSSSNSTASAEHPGRARPRNEERQEGNRDPRLKRSRGTE